MVCQGIIETMGTGLSLVDYLIYPTTCFYYFYAVLLFAIFLLITLFLYNRDRELVVQADLISSAGVSATAVLFLAIIGSLVKSTAESIPMIQSDILLYVVAFWIAIGGIWFFKS